MKRKISIAIAGVLLAAATGCAGNDAGAEVNPEDWTGDTPMKDGTIGVLNVLGSSEAQKHWEDTATQAIESIGWEHTVVDGKGDPAVEGQAINSFVQQQVDAILVIGGIAPQTLAAQLRQAEDADIPVLATGVTSPNDGGELTGVFAPPDSEFGVVMAEYLNENLPEGAPYVALDLTASAGAQAPNDAAEPILEEGGHERVGGVDLDLSGDLASQAAKAAGDLTSAHPDAKLLFGCCDFTAAITDPVLQQAGRDDVVQSVRYDNMSTLELMHDGSNIVTAAVNADAGVLEAIAQIVSHVSTGSEIDATADESLWEFKVIDSSNLPPVGDFVFSPDEQIDAWLKQLQSEYDK